MSRQEESCSSSSRTILQIADVASPRIVFNVYTSARHDTDQYSRGAPRDRQPPDPFMPHRLTPAVASYTQQILGLFNPLLTYGSTLIRSSATDANMNLIAHTCTAITRLPQSMCSPHMEVMHGLRCARMRDESVMKWIRH